jgi:predicted membrane protein
MKQRFSATTVIGLVVVFFGCMLLLRNVFHLDIPVFTLIISTLLIGAGILIVRSSFAGPKGNSGTQENVFGESAFRYVPGQDSYKIVFGSGVIDLKGLQPESHITLYAECTFGELKILVDRSLPMAVSGNVAFGTIQGPDFRKVSSGNYTYVSPLYNQALPGVSLDLKVNFGEAKIIQF